MWTKSVWNSMQNIHFVSHVGYFIHFMFLNFLHDTCMTCWL